MVWPLCSIARNPDGSFVRPTPYEVNGAETLVLTLAAVGVLVVILRLAWARRWRPASPAVAWLAGAGVVLMALHPLWTVSTIGGDCGELQVDASWVVLGLLAGIVAAQLVLLVSGRREVAEYKLHSATRLYVIGSGRLVNLAAAEGHPPSVMDMSFATQALATEYCVKNRGKLKAAVHEVPIEVERFVAREKLGSMGITIDTLTKEQEAYLSGWEHGT